MRPEPMLGSAASVDPARPSAPGDPKTLQIVVGVLVILGFLAIEARFILRDRSGGLWLPRIVDDSIGMWTLRRLTGRRLGARSWDDDDVPEDEPGAGAADALSTASTRSRDAFTHGPDRVAPIRYVP